ncbi:DAN domain family member 5 [Trichomycterus rosablanca]|uniref:DAN domain family member 5 n=1 Tax=Trichomycterus rosablanca TaxID=2290929 RepID=UPI002F3574B0
MALTVSLCAIPRHAVGHFPRSALSDFEASGIGADEPVRGSVRVVKVNPHFWRHASGMFGKPAPKRSLFPSFLALGRAGPSALAHRPTAALPHLRPSYTDNENKKRLGMDMWQRVMQKSDQAKEALSLPFNSKDVGTQSCAALPFTQRITEEGCEPLTIQNKLCFGQCSSMFVPPNGGSVIHQSRTSCSRCGPSKAHTVLVRLRCGSQVRERSVMLVEECKCETGREEKQAENMASHL